MTGLGQGSRAWLRAAGQSTLPAMSLTNARSRTVSAEGLWKGLYGIAGPMSPGTAEVRRRQTLTMAGALLDAGCRVLQLRDKFADGRELLATARELRRLTR